ncbi:hypothetical protein LY10_02136 [Planktotalea frisia]|uniref:Uncharacterized protein n=1 Tax=Planktotalea frisia TaxID=696762 RepID=A0A1L9NWT2_9RHOB|nr:hypothetical protein [Planktotalea frisia]MDB9707264.1 hypothetical protein [Planktotalea frisia]OJI93701.1 hypothetical protein PFRI_20840 [Planktotalea frisia]PZX28794.1 hypothetical protein LY10_02136 [Planktotalea frisia]
MQHYPQAVENYTNTCLVMGFVNLLWIMIAIWAWKGFVAALLLSATVYHAIKWLDLRLARTRL